MLQRIIGFHRGFTWRGWLAVTVLSTAAVTWLWAHEGHAPLPTKGVDTSQLAQGKLTVSAAARTLLGVETDKVTPRLLTDKVLAYAMVVTPWQEHAYVTTRLPGKIVKLLVRPGDPVRAGQPLAEVESLDLEDLQNELLTIDNSTKLSQKVVQSLEELFQRGAASSQDLREAQLQHQQNTNALEIARFKWRSLGLSAESVEKLVREGKAAIVRSLPLLSPIAGTVIHADLTIGRVVEPAEHLFEIVDISKVWVKIGALEKDLHKIELGQSVELSFAAFPGEVFQSTVHSKGLALDPQTHLGTVWAELSNPPGQPARVLPGMYGQAQVVVSRKKETLSVPGRAVMSNGADRFVLVQNAATAKASEYQKRNVVTGLRNQEFVQILGGEVFRGDEVVTVGSHELFSFFEDGVLRVSSEGARNIGLRVEPAQAHVVENVLEINGVVDIPPTQRAFASSQLSGTIQKIRADRGQTVRAGKDVVAEIASLDLQKLQQDLLRAHLQLGVVEETLKRLRTVEQVVGQRRVWETESLYHEVKNRRDSVQRKLEAIGLSPAQIHGILFEKKVVETLPILAPLDGVIVDFDKVLGQAIKADEPLFEIHDVSQAWVQGYVSERDLSTVRLEQEARVRLVSDPRFIGAGRVKRSAQVFAADDRTLSVWVELQGDAGAALQHNMLARLTLVLDRPSAVLAVPLAAVVRDGSRAYVFVRNADGVFERKAVQLGRADDRHVQITAGLQAGEMVVVQGAVPLATAYAAVR